MICMVLAAGYATRLYPLTENFPKPLLKVRGATILDWLLEDIDAFGRIDQYVVVSNHKFFPHFERWAQGARLSAPITIVDDGTTDNQNRLGAVKDIQFAINKCKLAGDMLVIAGDNLLDFSLRGLVDYFDEKQATCLMRYYEPDVARLKKSGVMAVDADGRILSMVEKPAEPAAHWCAPPFYLYHRRDVPRVAEAIEAGCPYDAPGSFIAWLSQKTPVYAMEMPGRRYDIGDLVSYESAQQNYRGIING